VSTRLKITSE
ncbi:hypothetical protein D043_4080B, partial [Vibrio parahaemolyticus EKP-021]